MIVVSGDARSPSPCRTPDRVAVSFQDFFFRAVAANASSGLHSAPSTASKAIRRRSVWAGRGAAPPEFCGGPTGDRLMLKGQQEGAAMFDPTRLGRGQAALARDCGYQCLKVSSSSLLRTGAS